VTARANRRIPDARRRLAKIAVCRRWEAAFAAILLFYAAPAAAQIGVAASILSDDRFRGFSLSDGRPVGTIDLSYDSPTGFYAAASGILVDSPNNGVRPLGLQLDGGYAAQVGAGLTADLGIVHARYSSYSRLRSGLSYTEVYAGLEGRMISSRVYFSPRYFGQGATAYAEFNAHLPLGRDFTVQGHGGLFVPFYSYSRGSRSVARYDWRIGVTRPAGRFILRADLDGGGPRKKYYGDYSAGHAIVLGLDYAL
jgi:uncharacterized protein (TIGR02001 family)